MTKSLNINFNQLSIDSYEWEEGPRLRMYLKIFPSFNDSHSHTFNTSDVMRIASIFSSWRFPHTVFFGPFELLNVTLLGPYANSKYLNLRILLFLVLLLLTLLSFSNITFISLL